MIAPAWAMTTSRPVGSVMTAMSPVDAGADRGEHALAAVLLGRHAGDEDLALEPVGEARRRRAPEPRRGSRRRRPSCRTRRARRGDRRRARPAHGSWRPRRGIADRHDVDVADEHDPPPARPPEPPEDDRQPVARHLVAGPVGIGAGLGRIRLEPLDARRRPPPSSAATRSWTAPSSPVMLGTRTSRASASAAHAASTASAACRSTLAPRAAAAHPRRIGRVMHVGPPEPLTPISVAA